MAIRCAWSCPVTSAPTGSSTCPASRCCPRRSTASGWPAPIAFPTTPARALIPARHLGHRADRPLQRPLVHHQPARRIDGAGRAHDACPRDCLRRRPRHLGGRLLRRRRQDLAAREAGGNHGRYSFHEWTAPFRPDQKGPHDLQVRAVNRDGETQPAAARWNPAGYMRNVIETIKVNVA